MDGDFRRQSNRIFNAVIGIWVVGILLTLGGCGLGIFVIVEIVDKVQKDGLKSIGEQLMEGTNTPALVISPVEQK